LREKYSTDESTVAQSIEHYQSEIMDLKTRMASTENEYTSLQAVLEEREASLRETSKALANMHIVLKVRSRGG
jgi:chromosome segregation ATPase